MFFKRTQLPIPLGPALALLVISGCGSINTAAAPEASNTFGLPATPVAAQSRLPQPIPVIAYTVAGGFAPILRQNLEIHGSGLVTYSNSLPTTPIIRQWPKSRVDELQKFMVNNSFFSLRDRYTAPVFDVPSTTITLNTDERSKMVTFTGHFNTPQNLNRIDDKLRQVIAEMSRPQPVYSSDQ